METTSLTNFNVPLPLRNRFDAICHASGRTRTSVLVGLMTDYILHQSQLLATQNQKLELVDQMLEEKLDPRRHQSFQGYQAQSYQKTHQSRSDREFDLPDFLVSDGQGDW